MKFKAGVNTEGVQPPTWYGLGIMEMLYARYGVELVVTSLTDGVHPDLKNLHPRGFAADCRTSTIPKLETINNIVLDFNSRMFRLGYDCIREIDHIHFEFDPKPGRDKWLLEAA